MKKVLITRWLPEIAKKMLSSSFVVKQIDANEPLDQDDLVSAVQNFDCILSTVTEKFDKSVLSKSKQLVVISNYGAGLDNIDLDFANSLGIKVYNTPDIVTDSTADHTFALLLSLIRKVPQAIAYSANNEWKQWDPKIFLGEELKGKILGIIGFGKIGQAVARRAIGFGLKVVYHNRSKKNIEPEIEPHVSSHSFPEVLSSADYLSLHVPLTKKTKHLINKKAFDLMAKKPVILNMARGEIINTNDLIYALRQGLIRGVALDVTEPEPLPAQNELYTFSNCIISPHIGTATLECRREMARVAAENIVNHFN